MSARARTAAAAVIVAAAALVALGPSRVPAGAHDGTHTVSIEDNRFVPGTLHIDPGEEVTWSMTGDGPHTVTADDRTFSSGRLDRLGSYRHRFDTEGRFGYHCAIHAGMIGTIVVGDPPEPPPPPAPPTRRVPEDYASIGAALTGIAPGTVVAVGPGVYPEHVMILVDRVSLRGTGEPGATVIEPPDGSVGIYIGADDVTVERMTVRGARDWGVAIDDATDVVAADVIAESNGAAAFFLRRSERVALRDVVATGGAEAAIHVRDCAGCDLVIDGARAERAPYGFLGIDSGGVTIIRSTFVGNAVGIALIADPGARARLADGGHVWGNRIIGGAGVDGPLRGAAAQIPPPAGTGVWLAGMRRIRVEDNVLTGHARFGIVSSWFGGPSLGHRIIGNVLEGSGRADLAWDGIGHDVCFEGNRAAGATAGDGVRAEPQTLAVTARCSHPAQIPVPYPPVLAEMLPAPRIPD